MGRQKPEDSWGSLTILAKLANAKAIKYPVSKIKVKSILKNNTQNYLPFSACMHTYMYYTHVYPSTQEHTHAQVHSRDGEGKTDLWRESTPVC